MSKLNLNEKSKKILIIGLDNSGKTSIVLSLQRNINLLSYYSLKPTRGIDIINFENHGMKLNIWDFGGQAEYRENYLKQLNKYYKGLDKIIFVIDVQDIERYEIALDYLKKIVNALKKHKNNVNFSIFLHKFDPNLEKLENFTDKHLSLHLISKIKQIIPPEVPYQMFKTTIFTIFQKRPL
ncbi:MAG: ADP-ribosylation factor-like protein [Promethearchaeota archaeon]